jgi:hypothetical protein
MTSEASGTAAVLAAVTEQSLCRQPPTREQALALLATDDEEVLAVVAAAKRGVSFTYRRMRG